MTIVTFSRMVGVSLEVAKNLEKEGVSVEVINLRYASLSLSHVISCSCAEEDGVSIYSLSK